MRAATNYKQSLFWTPWSNTSLMQRLAEPEEMRKKRVPKRDSSLIEMNLVNGIQKVSVQSCGIFSMEEKHFGERLSSISNQ